MFLCLFISNSCDFNVRPSLSTVTQLNVQKCLLCLLRTTSSPQNQCVVVMAFVVSLCDHTLNQAARPFSRKQTARMAAHSFSNTKDFSVFKCLRTLFKKLSYLFSPNRLQVRRLQARKFSSQACSHVGRGHGGGHQGGGCGKRCRRKVEYDPEILQGHLHQGLQEDHWRRLPGKANNVSALFALFFLLLLMSSAFHSLSHQWMSGFPAVYLSNYILFTLL